MQDLVTPPLACHDPILLETVTRGRLHSTRDSQPSWSTGLTCGARSRRSRLALAFDTLPERAGILTPAAAMGDALTERLAAADGFTLEVERV